MWSCSGHAELWQAMQQRDRIYADPNATDADYMKAAELEGVFAEYGGYDAEARAGSILTDAGIRVPRTTARCARCRRA